ncbi:MAG: 2OG-Fe dioxygenase family protein [Rhodoferax sp.]|nr:2OG-Fe dioxygenase family protein [Rhodoferax sp.]
MTLAPPYCSPQHVPQTLAQQGYAAISPQGVALQAPCSPEALAALCAAWDDLPPDTYLKDGGKYRRRRHSCFVVEGGQVRLSPHRAHWQPLAYNALHGGMQRWFEPVLPSTRDNPAWRALLLWLAQVADALRGPRPWFVEAHQFRIDTTDGIGRPTPEGAHRDGVDFVAVFLVGRSGIKGGETRVFDAAGPGGVRFTLSEPWSLLLLDDARVIHETTPIQPLEAGGHRDTLVLTLRAGGFQGDSVPT